jgi:hypothetical protein
VISDRATAAARLTEFLLDPRNQGPIEDLVEGLLDALGIYGKGPGDGLPLGVVRVAKGYVVDVRSGRERVAPIGEFGLDE